MGRYLPWVGLVTWRMANASTAFRRLRRGGVAWRGLQVSYPTPRAILARALQPYFTPRVGRHTLGLILPGSYAAAAVSSVRHARCWRHYTRRAGTAAPAGAGADSPITTASRPDEKRPRSGHETLPLVTLYLTERCNSRCVTCGIGSMAAGTRRWIRSGCSRSHVAGRPPPRSFRRGAAAESGAASDRRPAQRQGLEFWLLTSGSLADARQRRDAVPVDHRFAGWYLRGGVRRIRGLDAFEKVCEDARRRRGGRAPWAARHPAAGQLPRTAAVRDAGARARGEPGVIAGGGRLQPAGVCAPRRLFRRGARPTRAIWRCSTYCSTSLEDQARRGFHSRVLAQSPARSSAGPCASISPRFCGLGSLPAGALQRARVLGRGRSRRPRVSLLLHSRAG